MSVDYLRVQEHLQRLKLTQALASLDRLAAEASQKQWSYTEFLGKILAEEVSAREGRRLAMRQRLAHFPWLKTLEQFDFSLQPGVDEKQIRELATLRFVSQAGGG